MTRLQSRVTVIVLLLLTGAAQAQVPSVQSSPAPDVPATRQDATPPNGVARGVIQPNRPVDSKMVTKPPAPQQHRMPVITPPGTAR